MFSNSFYFRFLKTCFWKYKKKNSNIFEIKKNVWLVEIKKKNFKEKKKILKYVVSLKNRKLFLKTENKGKKQLPNVFSGSTFNNRLLNDNLKSHLEAAFNFYFKCLAFLNFIFFKIFFLSWAILRGSFFEDL